MGPGHIPADQVAHRLRILAMEGLEAVGIEITFRPLALNGHQRLPPPRKDEIDLMASLVSPVVDLSGLEARLDPIEYEVFPQVSEVFSTEFFQTAVVRDEAGVEA